MKNESSIDNINLFDTIGLSRYSGYSRHHLYVLIRKMGLPFLKDDKGIMCFKKQEIDRWIAFNPKKRIYSKVSVKCAGCGKEFKIHNHRVGQTKNNYCGHKCRRTAKTIKCDWCEKEMIRVPAQIEKHNFCSKKCMGKYQTKFYSGVNSKHWLGDYDKYYGPNWNHQRNLARERDHFECQLCGKKEDKKQHDVHHKKAFALFGINNYQKANELNNLITLCNVCHSSIEPKRKKVDLFIIYKKAI